jgi:hypothetical protein
MSDFKGQHFNGAVILWAVRWYCKYGIYRAITKEGSTVDLCKGVLFDRSYVNHLKWAVSFKQSQWSICRGQEDFSAGITVIIECLQGLILRILKC